MSLETNVKLLPVMLSVSSKKSLGLAAAVAARNLERMTFSTLAFVRQRDWNGLERSRFDTDSAATPSVRIPTRPNASESIQIFSKRIFILNYRRSTDGMKGK